MWRGGARVAGVHTELGGFVVFVEEVNVNVDSAVRGREDEGLGGVESPLDGAQGCAEIGVLGGEGLWQCELGITQWM